MDKMDLVSTDWFEFYNIATEMAEQARIWRAEGQSSDAAVMQAFVERMNAGKLNAEGRKPPAQPPVI
jgi:hypothetical protein